MKSPIGEKLMEETEYWQARIEITQIPEEVGYETILIPMMWSLRDEAEERKIKKTWLVDPVFSQMGYGLELHLSNDLKWTFFLSAESEKDAITKGYTFLNFLEGKFLGLAGEVTVRAISQDLIQQDAGLFELRLPQNPLNFNIIERVIQFYRNFPVKDLKCYIIWGPYHQERVVVEAQRHYLFETYRVRIFLEVIPSTMLRENEEYLAQLEGYLDYLKAGIKDSKLSYAVRYSPLLARTEIYKATIIERAEACSLITPEKGDFTFPTECTLKRANVLKSKNVHYLPISKEDPNYIMIGHLLHYGKVEKNYALINIDDLSKNLLIGGMTGTGKTMLTKQMSIELYQKCPLIGILYLNLGKGNQEHFYKVDHVYKYGDPDLNIPYFVENRRENKKLDKSIQETASYIISSLGLREPLDKVLKTIMRTIYKQHNRLPTHLETVLKALKKWYEEHKYHEEYQTNILTAFENRVSSLFSDPLLSKTLMVRKEARVPSWYDSLMFGGKVMIDLSMCNSYVKLILANALFQLLRTYTPEQEVNELRMLIVIDEAQQILELPNHQSVNTDLYIAKVQLGEIFSKLMQAYRSKGLSFMIISNSHSILFSCVRKLSSLKILFRMENEEARALTILPEDQKYLMLLEPQRALVINGNTGERYAIKTVDFPRKYYR